MGSHDVYHPVEVVNDEFTAEISEKQRYKAYHLKNFRTLPQIARLTEEQVQAIEVVGQVLPFRTNNYVTDELIDWNDIPADPFFVLNFPQKGMLKPEHYNKVASIMIRGVGPQRLKKVTNAIQLELSPHPAGQIKDNRPTIDGEVL